VLVPELADAVQKFTLAARDVALGTLAGLHRSTSIEFSEHRRYTLGDDLRRIDWKALARSDRLQMKTFEDERNLTLYCVCDHSRSMGFGSTAAAKIDKARLLAAALAYIAIHQRDAVGLAGFTDHITTFLPARNAPKHFQILASQLVSLVAEGKSDFPRSFAQIAEKMPPRSVVVILSDLLDSECSYRPLLKALTARGIDTAILHILDPAERTFPYDEPATFEGMEGPQSLFTHPTSIRKAYLEEMDRFINRIREDTGIARVSYHLVDDNRPPHVVLTSFLHDRMRTVRRYG
jgi:uncharacterized protein (DUF58 family)